MSNLKSFLKQSKVFRAVLSPVLRIRSKVLQQQMLKSYEIYQSTVQEGKVVLTPGNMPGRFAMDANSHNAQRIIVSGNYEPEVTEILSKFKSSPLGLIVNVGANVGFFSVFLAKQFPESRVLAIEPNPSSFEYLVENVARNGLQDRIQCEAVCIGDKDGEVEFSIIPGKSEYSSIGGIVHPSVAGLAQSVIKVPIKKIESLVGAEKVGFLFIDTEGAEELVLDGAKEILLRDKPILYFECMDKLLKKFGSSAQKIESKLGQLGYIVRDGLKPNENLVHPCEGEALAYVGSSPLD